MKLPIMPDDDKLKELILFIAEHSEGDAPFGSVKLNKLLFFSDFIHYAQFGKSITGHKYQKLENGPSPKAMVPILEQMKAAGDLEVVLRDYYGKKQKRPMAMREPDLSRFSGAEVELVRNIVEKFKGSTASEISERSHQFVGWELAELGEEIPYEVALVNGRKPTEKEIGIGMDLASLAKNCLTRGK